MRTPTSFRNLPRRLKGLRTVALSVSVGLSIVGCDNDTVTGLRKELAVSEFRSVLLEVSGSDNLITSIDSISMGLSVTFESGDQVSLAPGSGVRVAPDDEAWTATFSFGSPHGDLIVPFLGSGLTITLIEDFNDSIFPLIQPIRIDAPYPGMVDYLVKGRASAAADLRSPKIELVPGDTTTVLGLYFRHDNEVVVSYFSPHGDRRTVDTLQISRGAGPPNPRAEILTNRYEEGPARLFLSAYRGIQNPFLMDQFGDYRWYANIPAYWALQQLASGNLLWADHLLDHVVEISLDGKTNRTLALPRPYTSIHHDVHVMRNGDLLLTVQDSRRTTVQDVLVLVDRQFGQVKRVWDLNSSIPRNFSLIYDEPDWAHVNAVTFDESDQSVIFSMQRRGLAKVSWDNELVWLLSDPRGYEGYENFLLDNDFGATWGQHDVQWDPASGTVYAFDNGLGRNYSNGERFSRGIQFSVDEDAKSATLIRAQGADKAEYFSPIISGLDFGSEGEMLVNFGAMGYLFNYADSVNWTGGQPAKSNPDRGAAWVEYSSDGAVLFEMTFSHVGGTGIDEGIYRVRYADIFRGFN
jgi:arylsulfate sulfotransferase